MLGLATTIFPHLHYLLIQSNRQTEQRSHVMLRENEESAKKEIFKWQPNNNTQTCKYLVHE